MFDIAQKLLEARELFEKGEYQKAHEIYEPLDPQDQLGWRDLFFRNCCSACVCKTTEVPERLKAVAQMSEHVPPSIFYEMSTLKASLPEFLAYYRYWLKINKRMIGFLRSVARNVHTEEAQSMYSNTAMICYASQVSLADNWLNNPNLKEETNTPSFVDPLIDMVLELYDELVVVFESGFGEKLPSVEDEAVLRETLELWTNTILCSETLMPFIHDKRPGYTHPAEKKLQDRLQYLKEHPKQTGGCYIATAVYGSYDCPQVWTLRRYRDQNLAKSWCGRVFIKAYYAISPTLVKWFGSTQWFKKLWQNKLDRMVEKLQNDGVESTPYKDKNW